MSVRALVHDYETEIAKLKLELGEAYDTVNQEQLRRQQLEEDLRRMFLKNMTVMNMEALSLFQVMRGVVSGRERLCRHITYIVVCLLL